MLLLVEELIHTPYTSASELEALEPPYPTQGTTTPYQVLLTEIPMTRIVYTLKCCYFRKPALVIHIPHAR
jgi:hypothetical protein